MLYCSSFLNDIDIKFSMPWLLWLLFLFLLCAWLGVENILFLVILVLTPDSYLLPLRLLALEIGNHVFITDFLFFFLISRIKIIPIMNLGVPLHGLPHVIFFFFQICSSVIVDVSWTIFIIQNIICLGFLRWENWKRHYPNFFFIPSGVAFINWTIQLMNASWNNTWEVHYFS